MKKLRLLILLVLAFLLLEGHSVYAMTTGFSTTEIDNDTRQHIISSIALTPLDKEPKKMPVCCFDVNEDERLVLGWDTNTSGKKVIAVYQSDGSFLYGYSFYVSGSFGVQWDNENILLYSVRGNVAISIHADGTIAEIREIEDTIENNSYWYAVNSWQRTVGTDRFLRKCSMGPLNLVAFASSQIIKIDAAGTETMIYDVNQEYLIKVIAVTLFVVLFVAYTLITIVQTIKKGGGTPSERN